MVLEQVGTYMQKHKSKHRTYTPHKNKPQMNHRPKCKMQNYKTKCNIGKNLDNFGFVGEFLGTTPKAQSMKKRIDKLDLIKTKNFCSAEDTIKRMKRHATD